MRGRKKTVTQAPSSPLQIHTQNYLLYLQTLNYSPKTQLSRKDILKVFNHWCGLRELTEADQINILHLESYQRYLSQNYRKKDGKGISPRTQKHHLCVLQQLFKWLCRKRHILTNPASDLELPRVPKSLPRQTLNQEEIEQVMNQPDLLDPVGFRDRTIMEVLYSTGIRRGEVVNLRSSQVDAVNGVLFIKEGKGAKDRYVPIGERALYWIEEYSQKVRPSLQIQGSEDFLFLTEYGEPMLVKNLSYRIRKHISKAELGKTGSCHMFRHSMATHMLNNGADIRFIQQILGHASLESTEIYTHVALQKVKEIHARTHPTAKLQHGSQKDF